MDVREVPTGTTSPEGRLTRPLVVGVDGSKGSSAALVWAAQEARIRHAPLKVVHAWHIPALAYGGYYAVPVDAGDWSRSTAGSTRAQIGEVLGEHSDLEMTIEVKEGEAAQVLVEESHHADLVVVGSRGHGGFAGVLLGSVSSQVAHHATCPVVIVRDGT